MMNAASLQSVVGRVAASRLNTLPFVPFRRPQASSRRNLTTSLNNILADSVAPPVQVKTITPNGIQLVDGLLIPSACIFLNGRVFLWDVPPIEKHGEWAGWSKDYFSVFEVTIPKPEILLLGSGKTVMLPSPALRTHLNQMGIQLDVMDTWNACSTYNLLSEEGRNVAAALLPPSGLRWKSTSTSAKEKPKAS